MQVAHTSMLHIRVEDDIKEQATQALNAMGLSVADAVRLFLHAETRATMEESRAMMAARRACFTSAG